ncbi:cystatin-like fold lipoprotein [Shouchella shacheensis]|uniref:cystatin-like fold lipoprotein n=1 Tax=Shouchella shacheensis TaxID=1649580 RepID=UPI0012FBF3BE
MEVVSVVYRSIEGDPRESADVTVWDDGRYIRIAFIDEEDGSKVREEYYEVIGDNIERLKQYEGETLLSKTPDYQEQMGEEL